ncbi:MAG: type II secretion system protein [bacterium]|nr:type II secretion system protein [bacterium]
MKKLESNNRQEITTLTKKGSRVNWDSKTLGFTLIELLVVIAIIGILASVVLASLNSARAKARDSERVQTMRAFKTALELYYTDFGKYPNDGSNAPLEGFSYHKYNAGTCALGDWYDQSVPADSVWIDNSVSVGFISELFNGGYISKSAWHDPSNPTSNSDAFNCRYIFLETEGTAGNVQKYLLHCNLESGTTLESNDGGFNNTVYEIMMPEPWICICGQDGKGGATVSPMSAGSC